MKSKVLLIDDSVTIHRVIDLSIDFDRYDIVKVFSKEDAALKIQAEQFDYILLDNKLDNIIISEYISELKQQQKSATIILLVGAFDRFDETDLEKTKADDYLVKPFDSQSLNEKLSSEVDMMPAGIVERIAEADFARDNDDFIQKNNTVVSSDGNDGITKEEYLKNLEEVALDDLTDKGYVEDLDNTDTQLEDKATKKDVDNTPLEIVEEKPVLDIEEPIATKNVEDSLTDDSTLTAVNNMINLNDLEEDEYGEDDGSHTPEDDLPLSSIELEEPLNITKSNELLESQKDEIETNPLVEDNIEEANNAIDLDTREQAELQETENNFDNTDLLAENTAIIEDVNEDMGMEQENIDIPDPMSAVHSPILPDIDDAAAISDDYLMQENLEVNNDSNDEILEEFPDFPDDDDISDKEENNGDVNVDDMPVINNEAETEVDTTMDLNLVEEVSENEENNTLLDNSLDTDSINTVSEETVGENSDLLINNNLEKVEDSAETINTDTQDASVPLFEDDDWLSDAPTVENQENNILEESLNEENIASNEEVGTTVDFGMAESDITEEPVENILNISDDEADSIDISENINNSNLQDETLSFDFNDDNIENNEVKTSEEDANNIETINEAEEVTSLESDDSMLSLEQIPVEDEIISSDNMLDEQSVMDEDLQAEETSISQDELINNDVEDITQVESVENNQEELIPMVENATNDIDIAPAPAVNTIANSPEIKEAETYKEDTTGRFGGITVTISRDEIMSMLGNAIDKYFLEEAVKEVIAANMKDIVRNIVPAIAEKYIKEEIERLKNDE